MSFGDPVSFGAPVSFGTFVNLLLTVLLPVVAGHLTRRFVPQSAQLFKMISPWIANIAILLIIAFVVAKFADKLQMHLVQLFVPLLLINSLGYAGGYFGGKLLGISESMRRALTLEVGMQNAGLGVALAAGQFKNNPGASVAPAVYVFLCMLTGTLLAAYWRNFDPLDEEPDDKPFDVPPNEQTSPKDTGAPKDTGSPKDTG